MDGEMGHVTPVLQVHYKYTNIMNLISLALGLKK